MSRTSTNDPAGLGRGPLTRRMPVAGLVPDDPPPVEPYVIGAETTPRGLVLQTGLSFKRSTIPGALAAIVWQIGTAMIPIIAGLAIDQALGPTDTTQLIVWLSVLVVDVIVLTAGFRVAGLMTMRSIHLLQHRLRITLSQRVLHPSGRPVKQATGVVLSTTTNDVMRMSDIIVVAIFSVAEATAVIFIAVVLLTIHWQLGLIVVVGAPAVLALVALFRGPFTRRTHQSQTLLAEAIGHATDLVTGYRVVAGIGAQDEAVRRYRESSRTALGGEWRRIGALARYQAASNVISDVFTVVVAVAAALFAANGHISIGELIAVVGLAQVLQGPLNQLTGQAGMIWAAAVASSGRILDLLAQSNPGAAQPAEDHTTHSEPATNPALTVQIRLGDGTRICVEPGRLVGVRAGDQLAAQIVDALLHPDHDPDVQVSLDGVDAADIGPHAYRSAVTVAPHESTLFTGTVADNLDTPGSPPHLRAQAATAASCDDFTDGSLNSDVGENGNLLSGGQRQRVALARALATDAPVLVLHDPTTSVDSVTEAQIAGRLPAFRQQRSTLLIASSPALLAVCDEVIDLRADQKVSAS